jgi:hypothetical protein
MRGRRPGPVSRWFVLERHARRHHRRLHLTVSKPYQNAILSTDGTCL